MLSADCNGPRLGPARAPPRALRRPSDPPSEPWKPPSTLISGRLTYPTDSFLHSMSTRF